MKNELEIYKAVNKCETHEELALVIESLTDEHNMIQGRTRTLNGRLMAAACRGGLSRKNPQFLTREWGIRQQALYIDLYKK